VLISVAAVIPAAALSTRRHLCATALPACAPASLSRRVPSHAVVLPLLARAAVPAMWHQALSDKALRNIAASFSPAGTTCILRLGL
jgi:hypothetical protein